MNLTPHLEAEVSPLGQVIVPEGASELLKDVRGGIHAQDVVRDLTLASGVRCANALERAMEEDFPEDFYSEKTTHRFDFDEESFLSGLGRPAYEEMMTSLHEEVVDRGMKCDDAAAIARKAFTDSPVNGKLVVEDVFSEWDFQAWIQAEDSDDCWNDTDFRRHQDKTVGIRVVRSQKRNSIIVPATKYTELPALRA
jgi:hypothetical protein